MSRRFALLARARRGASASRDGELIETQRPIQRQSTPLPATPGTHWTSGQVAALQRRAGNHATMRALGEPDARAKLRLMPAVSARAAAIMAWPLRRENKGMIHRVSVPRATTTDADWDRVPNNHLARVQAAVGLINSKVTSRQLINYFRDHAPGGTVNTLQQVANRARVWELRTAGQMGLSVEGGNDMAYDTGVYGIGRWQIAATLLHEMGHLARFPTEAECENTMDAANTYAPLIRRVRPRSARPGNTVTISGISFGPSQGSTDRVTLGGTDVGRVLSWGWSHAGQGQIRFRVPTGAVSGSLVVENNTIQSNAVPFTVQSEEAVATEAPPVTEATPASGPEAEGAS